MGRRDGGVAVSKYNARRVKDDGYVFDSQAEHRRYCQLKLLESAGEIQCLAVHPRFELLPKEGKLRAVRYEADFSYTENGVLVVEDVKGVQTAVFRLKMNMLRRRYPTVDVRIVPVGDV